MAPAVSASTPTARARQYPSKHETYVFGQSSADGTACIGCSWQIADVLSGRAALHQHDVARKTEHRHDDWVPVERGPFAGTCPCGEQMSGYAPLHLRVLAAIRKIAKASPTPEQLTEAVFAELVPTRHLLVDFEARTDSDMGDDYTLLTTPLVLAHQLNRGEHERLCIEIETGNSVLDDDAVAELHTEIEELAPFTLG